MFCKQGVLKKIAKFTGKKAPMLESLFNKVAEPTKRLQYSCFPVSIAKFLRACFFKEQIRWLLLIIFSYMI